MSNEVLTGLVSGSTNLEPGDNPDPTIKLSTAEKGALEIYLRDGETNVTLSSRFTTEIKNRNINTSNFLDYYTGVHFIIDENYTIGSSKYYGGNSVGAQPAISTGTKVEVGSGLSKSELEMNLYLREGARIIGLGGQGGTAGLAEVTWNTTDNKGISFDTRVGIMGRSLDGGRRWHSNRKFCHQLQNLEYIYLLLFLFMVVAVVAEEEILYLLLELLHW